MDVDHQPTAEQEDAITTLGKLREQGYTLPNTITTSIEQAVDAMCVRSEVIIVLTGHEDHSPQIAAAMQTADLPDPSVSRLHEFNDLNAVGVYQASKRS